jgi:beta-lactamase class D
MRYLIFLCCVAVVFCSKKPLPTEQFFAGKNGCLLLMNAKSGVYEHVSNDARCRERLPACSTFKVPLALMAFDSGVLKDENQLWKWDGQKRMLDDWNRDHTAASWMQHSVVWFSQRLTPLIGQSRLQNYLKDFHYGNEDLAGGLTQAWLNEPDAAEPALRISAYEQAEFMRAFWQNRLKVKPSALALTQKITYLETSPAGYQLHGKTGSNFYTANRKKRLGWFIGHLEKGSEEYIVATFIP